MKCPCHSMCVCTCVDIVAYVARVTNHRDIIFDLTPPPLQPLTLKVSRKQMTALRLQKFKNNISVHTVLCCKSKDWRVNTVDPYETAHDGPSNLDLHCFQFQLLLCMVL